MLPTNLFILINFYLLSLILLKCWLFNLVANNAAWATCLPCELCPPPSFLLFKISQWSAIRKNSSAETSPGKVSTKFWSRSKTKKLFYCQTNQRSSKTNKIRICHAILVGYLSTSLTIWISYKELNQSTFTAIWLLPV